MNIKKILSIIVIAIVCVILFWFFGLKNSFISEKAKFSIDLPRDYKVISERYATTTSDVLFGNGESTIVVKRFERTENVEQALNFMGVPEFYVFLTEQLKEDIEGYSVVSTSTIKINEKDFYNVVGKYTGKKSNKEVVQNAYLIVVSDAYYILGTDFYNDTSSGDIKNIKNSVQTFKTL